MSSALMSAELWNAFWRKYVQGEFFTKIYRLENNFDFLQAVNQLSVSECIGECFQNFQLHKLYVYIPIRNSTYTVICDVHLYTHAYLNPVQRIWNDTYY